MKTKISISAVLTMMLLAFAGWFGSSSQTQYTTFQVGDTSETFNLSNAGSILVTIKDTSVTGVDTIRIAMITGSDIKEYSPVAMRNLYNVNQTAYDTVFIPTNGMTRTWFVEMPFPVSRLHIWRSNVSTNNAYAPVTRVTVTSY